MKPNLPIPTYSSDEFTWKGNRGITDLTDLVGPRGKVADRVRDDSIDIGFWVVSTRTGARMLFTEEFDEDGFDGEFRRFTSGDFTITIVND